MALPPNIWYRQPVFEKLYRSVTILSAHLWRRSSCTVVLICIAARQCFGGIFIVVAKAWIRRSPEIFSCLSSLLILHRLVQPRWTLLTVVLISGGRGGVVSLVFVSL